MRREILIVFTLLFGLTGPDVSQADQASPPAGPKIVWDRALDGGETSIEYKASTLTSEGEIVVAAMAADLADPGSSAPPFWLWRLDRGSGQAQPWLSATRDEASVELDKAILDIKALEALDDGGALLVVEFAEGRPSLLKIDKSGVPAFLEELSGNTTEISVFGALPRGTDKYLLWGHHSFDSRILEVQLPATVLWERTRDRGKLDFFFDGLRRQDGDLILVENSGEYDFLFRGKSSIWITRRDEKGKTLIEKELSGRHGDVTHYADLGHAMVYDKGHSDAQSIWVVAMDSNLEEIWRTPILNVEKGYSKFKIASLPGGDLVVAGRKGVRLFMAALDQKGEVKWDFLDDSMVSIADYDLLTSPRDGALFVFSSVYDPSDKQSVRIIRFGV